MEGNTKKKITGFTVFALISTAIITDLLTLIPFVGIVAGPLYWILVSIWLWTAGFGIVNSRRLTTSIVSAVAEVIPVVQEFPLITVGAFIMISMLKVEEKTGISVTSVTGPTKCRNPLNKGGVRAPEPKSITSNAPNLTNVRQRTLNLDGVKSPSNANYSKA